MGLDLMASTQLISVPIGPDVDVLSPVLFRFSDRPRAGRAMPLGFPGTGLKAALRSDGNHADLREPLIARAQAGTARHRSVGLHSLAAVQQLGRTPDSSCLDTRWRGHLDAALMWALEVVTVHVCMAA